MNPYDILTQIGEVGATSATLEKKDGRTLNISIKAEELEAEDIGGADHPGAVRVRSWSCNAEGLARTDFPEAGDRITYNDQETGGPVSFKTTRDAKTGRYWNWRYMKRGVRIVFYTKYASE